MKHDVNIAYVASKVDVRWHLLRHNIDPVCHIDRASEDGPRSWHPLRRPPYRWPLKGT